MCFCLGFAFLRVCEFARAETQQQLTQRKPFNATNSSTQPTSNAQFIQQDVKVRVVELMDHVLSTYDRRIGEYTATQWRRTGIELVLNSRVASVRDGYGACRWGEGPLPGRSLFP